MCMCAWCGSEGGGSAILILTRRVWWYAVSCLVFVVTSCFSADGCGGELRRAAAVSCLACLVASHAVLTWRAGEGGGLILPALAKSAPTLPSPPRQPAIPARLAALRVGAQTEMQGFFGFSAASFFQPLCLPAFPFSRVSPHSGAGAHGIDRARGEPFRQSLLAVCGGRLTP